MTGERKKEKRGKCKRDETKFSPSTPLYYCSKSEAISTNLNGTLIQDSLFDKIVNIFQTMK